MAQESKGRRSIQLLLFFLFARDAILSHFLKQNVTNMSQMGFSAKRGVLWTCCVKSCNYKKRLDKSDGAEGGTRTPMGLLPLDPESTGVSMVLGYTTAVY